VGLCLVVKSTYKLLFDEGMKLVEGRVNLDGHALPEPGFLERRRLLKGARLLEQAANHEPPYGAASFMTAKVYERLGRYEDSLRWMRKAQFVAPDNLIVALELGAALSRQGLHAEAVTVLTAAVTLGPNDPRVHGNLGVSLLLSGDTEGSIAAFRNGTALEPDEPMNGRLLNLALAVLEGRKPRPTTEAEILRDL
jgi:Flp pilus assembly protein TadD